MNIAAIRNQFLLLGQQWRRSLTVFLPANLKLFALVSINAFLKASKVFFTYFWWMPLIPCLYTFKPSMIFGLKFNWVLLRQLAQWFFILLAIRPSIDLKTARYFISYIPRFIAFVCFILVVSAVQWLVTLVFHMLFQLPVLAWVIERGFFLFNNLVGFMLIPSPLLLFAGYFLLDSDGTVKSFLYSCMRSIKMLCYTYPFCLISLAVFLPLFFVGDFLIALITRFFPIIVRCVVDNVFMAVYHLFVASWFSTIYIKRAHEDFPLYFE